MQRDLEFFQRLRLAVVGRHRDRRVEAEPDQGVERNDNGKPMM